ncbi:MAG: poly-gamma-glutamate synthase PgsB [Acholeplasmataceae bacterium]
MIEIVSLGFILLYLGYLFFEKYYHKRLRSKLKHVIHVNGIRGKSTTCRLIDAGLREAGYKVFTKTTGTIPSIINVSNEVKPLTRFGRANIIEQYKILRKAVKEKADILVIECMAITPELQNLSNRILDSDITIITNIYHDHVDVMGSTLDDIAKSLSKSTPIKGSLILPTNTYSIFEEKAYANQTTIHYTNAYKGKDLFNTFKENIEIALKVAEVLNIDENVFLKGFSNYHPDKGAFSIYKLDETIFFNGFSINDPDSIKRVYQQMQETYQGQPFSILINFRDDRHSRTHQHIELLKTLQFETLYIMGNNTSYVKNKLKRANIDAQIYHKKHPIKEKFLFGMGNYKNTDSIVEMYKQGEQILPWKSLS